MDKKAGDEWVVFMRCTYCGKMLLGATEDGTATISFPYYAMFDVVTCLGCMPNTYIQLEFSLDCAKRTGYFSYN